MKRAMNKKKLYNKIEIVLEMKIFNLSDFKIVYQDGNICQKQEPIQLVFMIEIHCLHISLGSEQWKSNYRDL